MSTVIPPSLERPLDDLLGKNISLSHTVLHPSYDMGKVACVILGGGQGTRLYPLTQKRCKPAIWFGGRYRLIDVPVSNAINSKIHKIFIITQFLSSSLHRHIFQTYRLDSFSSGFIEVLGAEQKPEKTVWFQGTADAVRQNLEYLMDTPAEYFLILSGDQLYHMDYQKMVYSALNKGADVMVATLPVNERDAKRMGIMKVNEDHDIIDFYEKPQEKTSLEKLRSASSILESMGLTADTNKQWLGSMGIYLFKRSALFNLLKEDPREDFGKHLIPSKVKMGHIAAYPYQGYWEDIGTIESFYKANIALTSPLAEFSCYNEHSPIFTCHSHLPGPKISHTHVLESIICEGSLIEADHICRSILGQRSIVRNGTTIRDSYVMGNDFYQPPIKDMPGMPNQVYIGEDSVIKKAIIDTNVHIGNRVELVNKNNLKHYDGENIFIRDGIIVVPKGASIPDDFVL